MSDVQYYLYREQEERALAAAAKTAEIRAIHETLARKYAELGWQETPSPAAPMSERLSA